MGIDWLHFTPWRSLAGGALIGLAAALLMLANGRVAGISGIVGGLLRPVVGDARWRIAFICGLLAVPAGWAWGSVGPAIRIDASLPVLVGAGLLVGFGTRCGGGCTSGHGLCGVARLSPRSLVATALFVAAAAAGFRLVRARRMTLLGEPMVVPAARTIDRRLVVGSVVFGIGWGLAGFVAAMLAGMGVFAWLGRD